MSNQTPKRPLPSVPIRKATKISQIMDQIGTSGIKRMGAYVYEEYLTELQGNVGRAKYREMSTHPVVKRLLRAVRLPMLSASWGVQGGTGPDEVVERAREFLGTCMEDMSHSWYDGLDEAITGCATYGWAWCQVLYKHRLGPEQTDPKKRSKFSDGLTGWRKWSFRGQETSDGWKWDEDGDLEAMLQLDRWTGKSAEIPLSESLHFILEGRMGDPEGESLLRSAYSAWYGHKHISMQELIHHEKMGGIPHFHVDERDLNLFDETDADMTTLRSYLEDAGTALRIDEQATIVTPWGISFKLEGPPAGSGYDTTKVLQRLSWEILGTILAQFLELGMSPHGSYGKSESDQDLFLQACQSFLSHGIAETINQHEIPRLFRKNAGSFPGLEEPPYLVPSDIQTPDLMSIAEPLSQLVAAGAITVGPTLEAWLRQLAKIPEEEEGEESVGKRLLISGKGEESDHYTLADIGR